MVLDESPVRIGDVVNLRVADSVGGTAAPVDAGSAVMCQIAYMARRRQRPMMMATRSVTFRDFLIFQLKLWLDGLKGVAVITLSTGAMVLDFIAGQGRRPRLFYTVVRVSERFDRWLNLYAAVERMEAGESDDGLFGASTAGEDTLLGQIEKLTRGGDVPRPKKPEQLP